MSYYKYLANKRMIKIRYLLACLMGKNHIEWLKRNKVFKEIGEKCFYQPTKLPNEPKLIKLHNNVKIATDVTFFTHDVINAVFADIDNIPYQTHGSCIEIFDNSFIGGGATIIGDVKIGPNAIVAAGAVVTKNVPEGTIVGGNPARVIGYFEELKEKRKMEDGNKNNYDPESGNRCIELWEKFDEMNKSR